MSFFEEIEYAGVQFDTSRILSFDRRCGDLFPVHPLAKVPAAMKLVIGADEVPANASIRFQITPLGFFRQEGQPLSCELKA